MGYILRFCTLVTGTAAAMAAAYVTVPMLLSAVAFPSDIYLHAIPLPSFPSEVSSPTSSASTPADNAPAGSGASYNWSGYATTKDSYTGVSGTWVVPAATGEQAGANATWVGIGGVQSHDLIQAGTQVIHYSSGEVAYQSWYELLPSTMQYLPLPVHAGDHVTVSINETGENYWHISFRNLTTGGHYDTSVSYRSSHSSAEWIEEVPSFENGMLMPLDEFTPIVWSNASALAADGSAVTIGSSGAYPITMVSDAGDTLAYPSPLGENGQSFAVTRGAPSSPYAGAAVSRRRARREVSTSSSDPSSSFLFITIP